MNELQQNNPQDTANIADDRVLTPVYCTGSRYNFKKGFEHCNHKKECKAFKDYDAIEVSYELTTIRFYYIKDFRKCERWLNRC